MMGIFLLLGSAESVGESRRNRHRTWLNIAHAAVMTVISIHLLKQRRDLLTASAVFAARGAFLIWLAPAKQLNERASATRD